MKKTVSLFKIFKESSARELSRRLIDFYPDLTLEGLLELGYEKFFADIKKGLGPTALRILFEAINENGLQNDPRARIFIFHYKESIRKNQKSPHGINRDTWIVDIPSITNAIAKFFVTKSIFTVNDLIEGEDVIISAEAKKKVKIGGGFGTMIENIKDENFEDSELLNAVIRKLTVQQKPE